MTDIVPVVQRALTSVTFSHGVQRAVIVSALAGILSCLAVSFLLLHIVSVAVAPLCTRKTGQAVQDGERAFLRRQLGVFVLCLLASDFIQSISGMIQIEWAIQGGITDGTACRAQAVLLLAGDLGVCVWNAVVAVHTFVAIVLRRSLPNWVVVATVVVGWSTVVLLSIIGPLAIEEDIRGPFYGVAKAWCFVTDPYADARLWLHYVPIFISLFVIGVLYILVFFSLRGNIVMNMDGSLALARRRLSKSVVAMNFANPYGNADIAKKMLWYPAAYIIIILPIASARLAGLRDKPVPQGVWLFAITLLFLSGLVNVVIYSATRKALKPVHWSKTLISRSISRTRSNPSTTSAGVAQRFETLESFGNSQRIWITCVEETHFHDDLEQQRPSTGGTKAEPPYDEFLSSPPFSHPSQSELPRRRTVGPSDFEIPGRPAHLKRNVSFSEQVVSARHGTRPL